MEHFWIKNSISIDLYLLSCKHLELILDEIRLYNKIYK